MGGSVLREVGQVCVAIVDVGLRQIARRWQFFLTLAGLPVRPAWPSRAWLWAARRMRAWHRALRAGLSR